jgi:hypothetical protein
MADTKLSIDPPRPDRPPLKVNVFAAMQHGNTQLMPLFPYLYPGAMVPAGAILRGGPDAAYGHFFHHNTRDEVVLTFGSKGCVLATGQVFVGGQMHGVNSFLKNEKDPTSYGVLMITQHQAEDGPQTEACSVRCDKCHEEVFKREFDATPQADANEMETPFVSVVHSYRIFAEYNADGALRTCQKCGHVNQPFPLEAWGWHLYAEQSDISRQAKASLRELGQDAKG